MKPRILKRIQRNDPEYGQVWALREEVLRKPLGLSLRDEDLSGEDAEITIAALQDNAVKGCVMLRPVSPEALKLRQMAVSPDCQGQGLGAALIREAEAFAKQQRFRRITLHARITAVAFYERFGYTRAGDVFSEVGIPHLLMQKHLS
jgi:predicted GNAT family N-acyltransferase